MSKHGNKMIEMQGISAHLEQIGPKWRSTGANCNYNDENICKNSSIATYMGKCVGRTCVYDYSTKISKDSPTSTLVGGGGIAR